MRLTRLLSGGNFGRLHKQYGEYRFALAPSQQNPWKGFLTGLTNVYKDYIWREWYLFTPPAVVVYLVYDWSKKANHRANRKNPKDFENDT